MKKYRKVKLRKIKRSRNRTNRARTRKLRAGSKVVKAKLLVINPHCDICGIKGDSKTLQLHHVYLIRHNYPTRIERTVLLCDFCHKKLHKRFDKRLDELYEKDHNTDFMAVYEEIKKKMQDV